MEILWVIVGWLYAFIAVGFFLDAFHSIRDADSVVSDDIRLNASLFIGILWPGMLVYYYLQSRRCLP